MLAFRKLRHWHKVECVHASARMEITFSLKPPHFRMLGDEISVLVCFSTPSIFLSVCRYLVPFISDSVSFERTFENGLFFRISNGFSISTTNRILFSCHLWFNVRNRISFENSIQAHIQLHFSFIEAFLDKLIFSHSTDIFYLLNE